MADQQGGTVLGGVRDVDANANDLQVESLARFAVDEHNKKEVYVSITLFCLFRSIEYLFSN
ncbi:hypothetical protein DY000_02019183 [Brassica cretica]|uniref:Cysteine proteinase inhibitor n=1 Tax=Brassica cretica TaxID=69181 RepID=A0ABQ7CYT0_BRACR|nr:hypothetical protein DY000_02019183 [Brassica cretica]